MRYLQDRRIFLLIFTSVILVGLFLSLYLIKSQQDQRSKAQATTTISFSVTPSQIEPNDQVSFDLMLNPGSNLISIAEIEIVFNPNELQLDTTNNTGISINSTVFPETLEGPNISSGNIKLSLGTGPDPTKIISTPVKVATIYFKALTQNSSSYPVNASVSTGQSTKIFSVSPNDEAQENVLQSSTPGSVTINDPNAPVATPTNIPTPTSVPTNTPIPSPTITPTPTIIPTNTPIILPTVDPLSTQLKFKIFLHGIWPTGDNVNPVNSSANKFPLNPARKIYVDILDAFGNPIVDMPVFTGFIYHDPDDGSFEGTVDLGNNFAPGNYDIKVKTDRYLRNNIGNNFTITSNALNILSPQTLVAGDVKSNNALDIFDYQILRDCGYGEIDSLPMSDPESIFNTPKCLSHGQYAALSDLDDNGLIDYKDYSLFVRNLQKQYGR